MGRFYNGDIEGKFWFGVQSSDDPEFFGCKAQEPHSIPYYTDDLKTVQDGVDECITVLGNNKALFDEFFAGVPYYNSEDIVKFYAEKDLKITHDEINNILVWYARLDLGNKILDCVKENGYCGFEAET